MICKCGHSKWKHTCGEDKKGCTDCECSAFDSAEVEHGVYASNVKYDHVNPIHYKKGSMEVWEMMIQIFGAEKFKAFCELNAFKYRMRIGEKPGQSVEDEMNKIKWYEDKLKSL